MQQIALLFKLKGIGTVYPIQNATPKHDAFMPIRFLNLSKINTLSKLFIVVKVFVK